MQIAQAMQTTCWTVTTQTKKTEIYYLEYYQAISPMKKKNYNLWIQCQLNYVERRFGRKLTKKEKYLLWKYLEKKMLNK